MGQQKKVRTHGSHWKKFKKLPLKKIGKFVKKNKKVFILGVTVQYPKELHKNHNNLPYLAERLEIGKIEKLVPNLKDEKMYVVHIKSLNQAWKHDLKLKKGISVIRFEQNNSMKPTIILKTRPKNEFDKYFFKLMRNSFFGKTMEKIFETIKTSDKLREIFQVCDAVKFLK